MSSVASVPASSRFPSKSKVSPENGPLYRAKREAAAISMAEAAFKARCDMGQLSRFERGFICLSAERARNLDKVLRDAIRERSAKLAKVAE